MKQSNFPIILLLYSVFVGIAFYLLQSVLPAKATFPNFVFIQLFVLILTLIFHTALMKAGERSNQAFIRFFMAATAGRLFLYMIVMIGYALFNKETAVGFIIHLFLFYLLYTAFEVAFVYKKFSSNPNSGKH